MTKYLDMVLDFAELLLPFESGGSTARLFYVPTNFGSSAEFHRYYSHENDAPSGNVDNDDSSFVHGQTLPRAMFRPALMDFVVLEKVLE